MFLSSQRPPTKPKNCHEIAPRLPNKAQVGSKIIHIGQTVMAFDGTIDYFRDTVFNYPTMAECYKVAAFDGLNKLAYESETAYQEPVEVDVMEELVSAV